MARLEAASLARERAAELAQMVLRAAALALVDEQKYHARLLWLHALVVVQRLRVGHLTARAPAAHESEPATVRARHCAAAEA